ncbi:TPA: hypothetical protein U2R10_001714 [Proteus mirabilis]|uniref:Uncharacterized protein n=10 Tax=Proteus mirabilis TaxID=584 RepID=A0A7D5W5G5_PROMI|nr:hypothetical protein [Proteus mirabilis]MBA7798900.1 hypothetical protein [Citrobacter sp. RHBSTW-01065]MCK2325360.1 hypothetical protein [Escherichia coli]SSL78260.1 Uncharacterised protein [Klebsiella pneumoniae]ALE21867.1 hypothetical protein AOC00_06215 [Proteus mirabilis]ALE25002.1 hypothetical protein AOB99_06235 [Proteus mirabilis]
MKEIEQFYRELESAINFILEDKEYYDFIDNALVDYIENATNKFIYEWNDDFFEKKCKITLNINALLNEKSSTIVLLLRDFLMEKKDNYIELINYFYFSVLECYCEEYFGNKIEKNLNELIAVYFITLSYFSLDDQLVVFKSLIKNIKANNEFIDDKFSETLIPLVFYLSKKKSNSVNDKLNNDIEWGIKEFNFNLKYKKIVDGFFHNEDISSLLNELCNYHISINYPKINSTENSNHVIYKLIPCEVIVLLRMRELNKLPINNIDHQLINRFKMFLNKDIPLSNFNRSLRKSILHKALHKISQNH